MRSLTVTALATVLALCSTVSADLTKDAAQVIFGIGSEGGHEGTTPSLHPTTGDGVWRLDMKKASEEERSSVRSALAALNVDIWRQSPSTVDFRFPNEGISELDGHIITDNSTLRLHLLHKSVSSLVEGSNMTPAYPFHLLPSVPEINDPFHDAYHPLADIYAFGDRLVSAFDGVKIGDGKLKMEAFVLGQTWEEREIKGFRVKWVSRPPKPTPRPTDPLPTDTATMTEPSPTPTETVTETETVTQTDTALDPTATPEWEWNEVVEDMGEWEEWAEEEWETAASWMKRSKKDKHGKGKGKKGKGKKGKGKKGKKGGKKGKIQIEREFVVQSGSHAREWVGPSSAIYFIHSLLIQAVADHESEEATLLKSFTFTVIPTINPDGYEYSKQHRLWRKNRQDVSSELCSGIDLNTNWGYKWQAPESTSPCSDAYPGKAAFEAYETRAVADYLANGAEWKHEEKGDKKPRKVRAFIDLHSYGQLFMYPFAHSCEDFPPDAEMLLEAGLGVAKAMRNDNGETYQSGQACELTYRAPGDAIDYAYGVADIRWSYSAELRDTGTYGFLLPPSLIRPTADEISTGLVHLAKFIYNTEVVEHQ